MGKTTWTNKRVKQLTELWNAGKTGAEIGKIMGITRNSAIAKANRLGLQYRGNPYKKPKKKSLPVQKGNDGIKTLADIGQNECRYPCKNGMMCAKEIHKGSYCENHYNLCVIPLKSKRVTDGEKALRREVMNSWRAV